MVTARHTMSAVRLDRLSRPRCVHVWHATWRMEMQACTTQVVPLAPSLVCRHTVRTLMCCTKRRIISQVSPHCHYNNQAAQGQAACDQDLGAQLHPPPPPRHLNAARGRTPKCVHSLPWLSALRDLTLLPRASCAQQRPRRGGYQCRLADLRRRRPYSSQEPCPSGRSLPA